LNYYRLSQTDFDGTKKSEGNSVTIDNRSNTKQILRTTNILGQDIPSDSKGVIIFVYDDATTERIFNM